MSAPAHINQTAATAYVLAIFLRCPTAEHYAYRLRKATNIAGPTVLYILARLCERGWLLMRDEAGTRRELGRPARTYYRLSPLSIEAAEQYVRSFDPGGPLPVRLAPQRQRIMNALLLDVAAPRLDTEIMEAAGLSLGIVRTALGTFQRASWLWHQTEPGNPVRLGRPLRRYYCMTLVGLIQGPQYMQDSP